MTVNALDTPAYTDLQGLGRMRAAARDRDPEAANAVARQFEAYFIQTVFKTMRESALAPGIFDSDQSRAYQDLLDKQVAIEMANRGQIGLAETIARQIGGAQETSEPTTQTDGEVQPLRRFHGASYSGVAPAADAGLDTTGTLPLSQPLVETAMDPFSMRTDPATDPERLTGGPADFVEAMRPHAEAAARELGVQPEVLIAQAALESGWGRHVIHQQDGNSTHNLFGIKADSRWSGERAAVHSLEYEDGVARRRLSAFRAYGSYGESFRDYAEFIRGNPRYGEALQRASSPAAYMRALQDAGYATDPEYASKVMAIMQRVSPTLKLSGGEPLASR